MAGGADEDDSFFYADEGGEGGEGGEGVDDDDDDDNDGLFGAVWDFGCWIKSARLAIKPMVMRPWPPNSSGHLLREAHLANPVMLFAQSLGFT